MSSGSPAGVSPLKHRAMFRDPRVCNIIGRAVLGDDRPEILTRWEDCLPKYIYFIF